MKNNSEVSNVSKKVAVRAFESMNSYRFDREWQLNNILNKNYKMNLAIWNNNILYANAYCDIVNTFGEDALTRKYDISRVLDICLSISDLFDECNISHDDIQKARARTVDTCSRIDGITATEMI